MILFLVFLFLSIYNTGCMTALQIQHYGIYPAVPKDGFADYLRANNRGAVVPTIIPGMLLLVVSVWLAIFRPAILTPREGYGAFWLNFAAILSTLVWQARLQSEMAKTGYDADKVRLLIRTNWIRTISYWLQSALAISILLRLLQPV